MVISHVVDMVWNTTGALEDESMSTSLSGLCAMVEYISIMTTELTLSSTDILRMETVSRVSSAMPAPMRI